MLLFLGVLLTFGALANCAGQVDSGGDGPPPAPKGLCATIADVTEKCVGTTPCDQALVDDCANLVGILSPELVSAALACVQNGGVSPMSCLVSAVGGLTPTQADEDLASAFCSSCAFGVPGCTDIFFNNDGSKFSLGIVVLPFSDDVVNEIKDQCTNGPTCAGTFITCAEQTLAKHALPTATATCLLTNLVNGTGQSSGPMANCAPGGQGGAPSTGPGSSGGPTSTGSNGSMVGSSSSTASGSPTSGASSTGSGGLPCSAYDGNVAGCDADPVGCAYYDCSESCWPFGTPLGVACPCNAHDGDEQGCKADPAICDYSDCNTCVPAGTSKAVACPCSVHDGDVMGCDNDPNHDCAYFFCSNSCWAFGTQLDAACPCSDEDADPITCITSPTGCDYFPKCDVCAPLGTSQNAACPCAVHDGGDIAGCNADPAHCAYYLCSDSCWPFGTPIAEACP